MAASTPNGHSTYEAIGHHHYQHQQTQMQAESGTQPRNGYGQANTNEDGQGASDLTEASGGSKRADADVAAAMDVGAAGDGHAGDGSGPEGDPLNGRGRSKKRNFFGTLKKRLSRSKTRTHSMDRTNAGSSSMANLSHSDHQQQHKHPLTDHYQHRSDYASFHSSRGSHLNQTSSSMFGIQRHGNDTEKPASSVSASPQQLQQQNGESSRSLSVDRAALFKSNSLGN